MRAASSGERPSASWAASTEECVQPEPCAAPSGWRSPSMLRPRAVAARVDEQVDRARAVPAGEHDRARAERQHARERAASASPVLARARRRASAGERARLGQVRREHARARQDLARRARASASAASSRAPDSATITGSTTTGVPGGQLVERRRDRERDLGGAEHPDLDRVDADVREHRAHLREHDLRRDRMDGGDADRVLRGDRGDRARAVHAAARERLQVGLDAGAAAGVRAGDRQRGAASGCAHADGVIARAGRGTPTRAAPAGREIE